MGTDTKATIATTKTTTMATPKQLKKMDGGDRRRRCYSYRPCWISSSATGALVAGAACYLAWSSCPPVVMAFATTFASSSSCSNSASRRLQRQAPTYSTLTPRQAQTSFASVLTPLARTLTAPRRRTVTWAGLGCFPGRLIRTDPALSTAAAVLWIPRGGGGIGRIGPEISDFFSSSTPHGVFHSALLALAAATVLIKTASAASSASSSSKSQQQQQPSSPSSPPASARALQRKFLAVFWLLRCADWLQGPYFYEVYASKLLPSGLPVSLGLVSRLFLTGFASTALFGPTVGRLSDQYGRKRATLAFSIIYSIGALSTKSNVLWTLFAGRIVSGIGTSLLFSAPESWLVGAAQESRLEGFLGGIFGTAYAGDAIVAIVAGVLAGQCASWRGPVGPFELSTLFLAAGGVLAAFLWKENKAEAAATPTSSSSGSSNSTETSTNSNSKPAIRDAIQVVMKDPKIWLVGCVQSLFEAAMYIFVLQWPPAMSKFVSGVFGGGGGSSAAVVTTPYGTIFSCFMACCLLGSTIFGQLAQKGRIRTERSTAIMVSVATAAMTAATWTVSNPSSSSLALFAGLVSSFFAFEACVGVYFPSIGTLRSKYVPDSHRGVIMNLFGIPLNALVVGVFLSISRLGTTGALGIASLALAIATACSVALDRISSPRSGREQ